MSMTCDRFGCNNVMCERILQNRQWYICPSCFEELVHLGPVTNIQTFMEKDVLFINSEEASRAFFNEIFPLIERIL